jgi:hypothetical protein
MAQHDRNQPTPKLILTNFQNLQDNCVIRQLCTTPISKLPVDGFARFFCKADEKPNEERIVALRYALIRVYMDAADARSKAKATSKQLTSAGQAMSLFKKALKCLDNVAPPTQRGLQAAFGPTLDDWPGLNESNEFHLSCSGVRLDAVPFLQRLHETIEQERYKPVRMGERKKRLRTLVEGLANWWVSTGRSVAPYVYAKRRDNDRAVVIKRQGEFIEIACALFCEIDKFKESEVEAAITNVHEARLKKTKTSVNSLG